MLDTEPRAAVIDGKVIATKVRAEIAIDAAALADKGWQPHLVSISVGDTAAAELYVRNQQRSAESAGVTLRPAIIRPIFRWSSWWVSCKG